MKLFEKLNELNKMDEANGTSLCGGCNDVVAVNAGKKNGTITIGVPLDIAHDLAQMAFGGSTKRVILVIIDSEAFGKL